SPAASPSNAAEPSTYKGARAADRVVTALDRFPLLEQFDFECPEGHPIVLPKHEQIVISAVGASNASKSFTLAAIIWDLVFESRYDEIGVTLENDPSEEDDL